jgi:succinate dehydrogenase / fumarate reductase membrane anchor subunit
MSSYTRMQTPLAKAKSIGSGGGTHHWWLQRLTSIILLPLVLWLVYFLHSVSELDAEQVMQVLQKPYNLVPAMLFLGIGMYHGMLGMQVVIEDYVSNLAMRYFLIVSVKIFTTATIVSGAVALLILVR